MKKRYLSFVFALVMIMPCMLLFTACGGKQVTSVTVDNLFVGEAQSEYVYGIGIGDIISNNINVTATYDDNSTQVLQPNEYTINYYKDNQLIDSIKDIPDVGYYTVYIKYENLGQATSFEVIPTYNNSIYTLNLTKNTWAYGDELPEIFLNYTLKDGETVTYKYVEKSIYDGWTDVQKSRAEDNAKSWADAQTQMSAGEYYVFGKIDFVENSNYKGTKIDTSCLVTVTAQIA